MNKRIDDAVELAKTLFWESIASSFPEATTGDLDPIFVALFDSGVYVAVEKWIENNVEKFR